MIKFSSIQPDRFLNTEGKPFFTLNIEVRESTKDEITLLWEQQPDFATEKQVPDWFANDYRFCFREIEIAKSDWTRDGIINAIIRDKYRIDEMEAITNNMAAINAVFMQTLVTDGIVAATKYLKESINDENSERFKEMQEWRAMAKKIASSIIKQ
jgi:hypothetical protein